MVRVGRSGPAPTVASSDATAAPPGLTGKETRRGAVPTVFLPQIFIRLHFTLGAIHAMEPSPIAKLGIRHKRLPNTRGVPRETLLGDAVPAHLSVARIHLAFGAPPCAPLAYAPHPRIDSVFGFQYRLADRDTSCHLYQQLPQPIATDDLRIARADCHT
jgi:hypothetical protein